MAANKLVGGAAAGCWPQRLGSLGHHSKETERLTDMTGWRTGQPSCREAGGGPDIDWEGRKTPCRCLRWDGRATKRLCVSSNGPFPLFKTHYQLELGGIHWWNHKQRHGWGSFRALHLHVLSNLSHPSPSDSKTLYDLYSGFEFTWAGRV